MIEWYFNTIWIDHGDPITYCDDCGREENRFAFQIQNINDGRKLWVGKDCVLKYQTGEMRNGNLFLSETTQDYVDAVLKEYHKEYYEKNKEKIAEHQKEYYEDNQEYIRARELKRYYDNKEHYLEWSKEYYQENKEHIKERSLQYYHKNKEHIKEYYKEYYQENKEYLKERQRKRDLRKKAKRLLEKQKNQYNPTSCLFPVRIHTSSEVID